MIQPMRHLIFLLVAFNAVAFNAVLGATIPRSDVSTELRPRQDLENFRDTCHIVRYYDPNVLSNDPPNASPYLVAKCRSTFGAERCSWLPLTSCLGNDKGRLVEQEDGGFHDTCHKCSYARDSAELTCQCRETGPGAAFLRKHRDSTIDLSDYIKNWDGLLACGGTYGLEVLCYEAEFGKIRKAKTPKCQKPAICL